MFEFQAPALPCTGRRTRRGLLALVSQWTNRVTRDRVSLRRFSPSAGRQNSTCGVCGEAWEPEHLGPRRANWPRWWATGCALPLLLSGTLAWAQIETPAASPGGAVRTPPAPAAESATGVDISLSSAPARPSVTAEDLRTKLAKRGSITLRDSNLHEALFAIREQWKLDLVFGNELQGEINAAFTDAPLHEILDTLLTAKGYGYMVVGRSLVIRKLEEIGSGNPLFETETIPVRNGNPSEIEILLRDLKLTSANGKLVAVPSAKSVLVMDFPDRVASIRQRIEELDAAMGKAQAEADAHKPAAEPAASAPSTVGPQPPAPENTLPLGPAPLHEPAFFDVFNVPAKVLEPSLSFLLSDSGQLSAIDKENRIVVVDTPEHIERISRAIRQLDVPRPQVRIWALIYDVGINDLTRIGINWNSSIKGSNRDATGAATDSVNITGNTVQNSAAGAVNGAIRITSFSRHLDLTNVINALDSSENSRLLANPNVVVVDQEQARISIVKEIPFQQLTQGIQGGSIGTTAFREAGVTLQVTPRISEDGTIEMQVNPIFSVLSGFTESSQPIIDKREAQTVVRVPSGETFVLGGLRQRQTNNDRNGLPVLQDMKFGLGYLFRSRQTKVAESELLVFLTPEIITVDYCKYPREAAAYDYGRFMLNQTPVMVIPPGCEPYGPIPEPVMAPLPGGPDPGGPAYRPRIQWVGPQDSATYGAPPGRPVAALRRLPSATSDNNFQPVQAANWQATPPLPPLPPRPPQANGPYPLPSGRR